MANNAPNSTCAMLLKGQHSFSSDTFKIILMQTGYVFNEDTHNSYSNVIAYEISSGNGYTTGGLTLTGANINIDNVNNKASATFNNATWTANGGSITASGAIIYNDSTDTASGDDYTDAIVGYIDFGGTVTATDGSQFTIANIGINIISTS